MAAKYAEKIGTLDELGEKYDKKFLYYVKNGAIYRSPRAIGGAVPGKPRKSKANKSRFEAFYEDSERLEGTRRKRSTKTLTGTRKKTTKKRMK